MELLSLIITGLVSLASGGGICYLIFFREKKREARLNNKQLEEDIDSKASDNMVRVFDQVQEQNDKFMNQLDKKDAIIASKDEIINEKEEKIMQLNKKINNLHIELNACSSFLCENDLCPLREPAKGLGPMIFKQMSEKGELKGNQKSIVDIAKKKGYTIERIVCKN